VSAAAVAIAWVLRTPVVTGAIVGARRPEQVDGLLDATRIRLNDEELEAIRPYLPEGTGVNVPGRVA